MTGLLTSPGSSGAFFLAIVAPVLALAGRAGTNLQLNHCHVQSLKYSLGDGSDTLPKGSGSPGPFPSRLRRHNFHFVISLIGYAAGIALVEDQVNDSRPNHDYNDGEYHAANSSFVLHATHPPVPTGNGARRQQLRNMRRNQLPAADLLVRASGPAVDAQPCGWMLTQSRRVIQQRS